MLDDEIMEILYTQGPRTLVQLCDIAMLDMETCCEIVSALIVVKRLHLESDGTLWYAEEA